MFGSWLKDMEPDSGLWSADKASGRFQQRVLPQPVPIRWCVIGENCIDRARWQSAAFGCAPHEQIRGFHRVTDRTEAKNFLMPSLHALRNLPKQIRPALAGVEVTGSTLDPEMKSTGSFLLRGAMQSANHTPVGDGGYSGGPNRRRYGRSNGRGGYDDIPDFGFANQAAARSTRIKCRLRCGPLR